jgi:hypothetical protein
MKTKEDWYLVSANNIVENGGQTLMQSFNNSLYHALSTVYHDYNWLEWKFKYLPSDFWNDKDLHDKYFEWLGSELRIKIIEDWYNVKVIFSIC